MLFRSVQRLMEITLHHCSVRGDSLPASFFCRRLTSLKSIALVNFPFIRDCLLRIARDFTICLKSVTKFVTQYRALLSDAKSKAELRKWCGQILSAHTPRGHDLEIACEARTRSALAARPRPQPLRYTQTRAGGRFIQMRSEASVETPGSDFGIGGTTE